MTTNASPTPSEGELPTTHDELGGKTPWEFACAWYTEGQIAYSIARMKAGFGGFLIEGRKIPEDIYSEDFAKWLTHEYRLAMRKGIEIGGRATAAQQLAEARAELATQKEIINGYIKQCDNAREAYLKDYAEIERLRAENAALLIDLKKIAENHVGTTYPVPADEPPLWIQNRSVIGRYEDDVAKAEAALTAATELAASHAAELERVRVDNVRLSERTLRAEKERDQMLSGNLDAMRAKVRADMAAESDRFADVSAQVLCDLLETATVAMPTAFYSLMVKVRKHIAESDTQLTAANARAEAAEGALAKLAEVIDGMEQFYARYPGSSDPNVSAYATFNWLREQAAAAELAKGDA